MNKRELAELKKDAADLKKTGGRNRFKVSEMSNAGGHIRAFRAKLGLSQADLASSFGVSVKRVQNWEQETTATPGWAKKMVGLVKSDPKILVKLQHM